MSICAHLTSQAYLPNVPLKETIGICAEALYKKPSSTPLIPQAVFIELIYGKCYVIRRFQLQ